MRKRDEMTDPGSCWNKARDHEWLFVLLERDPAGPHAVREWVKKRVELGLNAIDDPKMLDALAWADRVEVLQAQKEAPRQ